MTNKPVVFISATSDLRSARDLVGKVLYSMGYEPVWQDIAATAGGELLAVLRQRIEPCAMMVQLVGQRYGAEPPQPTAEFGRVSYTQYEALYAERLGRKVLYHVVAPEFPLDAAPPEAEELAQLQSQYQAKLVATNRLRQEGIASAGDLELSIRRISDELAALRAQAERRARRTFWLIGAALVGVAAAVVGVLMVLHKQHAAEVRVAAQSAELKDELAAMRSELLTAIAPKPLTQGQTKPDPLPPELIEKAKTLLERGNAEDQALAKIALKQHDEANRIIQELKAKPGNPIDEAFRLLTLEGDNWYQAGQPDKAVEPYEKALALHPTDPRARDNATMAHLFSRLGTIADHKRRAIEIAEGTLKLAAAGSKDWAKAQHDLGMAHWGMPTGDLAENLGAAIACYDAALTVRTKAADPTAWAWTQNNLGLAWADMPTGDKTRNLHKAIDCYEAALTIRTKAADPIAWAWTQSNLGLAWSDMPAGDKSQNLRKSIAYFETALAVCNKAADPSSWAWTQGNLGDAWWAMPTGNKAENLHKAIECFQGALTVYTEDSDPLNWAWIQNDLGLAWSDMPTGVKTQNVSKAIECYEAALRVRTNAAHPRNWAATQNNLGLAWSDMPTGDKAKNVRKAIACYEAVLTVYKKDALPIDWAMTQNNLGLAWSDMPTSDKAENLRKAVQYYEAALTVRTKDALPTDWSMTQNNLGNAWYNMPTGDKAENLRKAVQCYEAALTVRTKDALPIDWAMTQDNLGDAWCAMPTGDKAANLNKAVACYEAALTVRTQTAAPSDWAITQIGLGAVWFAMPGGDKGENFGKAMGYFKAALSVSTRHDNPKQWAAAQLGLAGAYLGLSTTAGSDVTACYVQAIACCKGVLLVLTPDTFPQEHESAQAILELLRKAYESSAGPKAVPFDKIPPAQ